MASKKKTTPAKPARVVRTADDKLRTLVNLKIVDKPFFTQKEIAAQLGISTRTLRRFKNQKDYRLSEKTIERIKEPLAREDRKISRLLDRGAHIVVKTVTTRGKRRKVKTLEYDKSKRLPKSKVRQLPVVYESRSGDQYTERVAVKGWSTEQKIELIEAAHAAGDTFSWHAKVMVPPGVGRSGRKGEGEIVDDEPEEIEDEETGEIIVQNPKPEYYMTGPFDLKRNRAKIRSEIDYHEDAGRVIVEIFLTKRVKK